MSAQGLVGQVQECWEGCRCAACALAGALHMLPALDVLRCAAWAGICTVSMLLMSHGLLRFVVLHRAAHGRLPYDGSERTLVAVLTSD